MIIKELNLKNSALYQTKSFINNEWVDASDKQTYLLTNPYDQSVIGEIADLGANETQEAIHFAEMAFDSWKKKPAFERANLLKKLYHLIMENQEDLAKILTWEQGKPLAEAKGEIVYGASFIEWFAEEARRIYGDVIPSHGQDKRIITLKQPVGVVGIITPWNFPNAMITRKLGAALAAGCTVVIKPAGNTPLSALALACLVKEAGFAPGVVNIITSNQPAEIGKELCANKSVRKISFTGSTAVGKILIKQAADTVKKVSMELGGNAPFIVFNDANIDEAVEGAMLSKFRNAGQTCVCANRIYVQSGIYEVFVEKFKATTAALVVGNGFDEKTDIGAIIDKKALTSIQSFIADALNKGAELVQGGELIQAESTLMRPAILCNLRSDMLIAKEEIFGPVAPIFKFETEEEVIQLANNTDYGLASYFYGQNINQIWRVAEALEYGMVGINTGLISTTVAPFGGIKQSGNGREGSKYGVEDYTEIKYLCFGGIS
jgi:succinate-semialdehyde dehydrogenase / glutarate-semialdehyde dehydrogenase